MKISEIDKNLALDIVTSDENTVFMDVSKAPFQVTGVLLPTAEEPYYRRMPQTLADTVSPGVSELNHHTAGGRVRFRTDSPYVSLHSVQSAVCLMNQLPISLATVIPFIMTLGIAMVASPGAPGGSIMTALPFLYMIFGPEAGDPNGPICAIMVALYITQDSFGTACNVSGDNAIGIIVDAIYNKFIKK